MDARGKIFLFANTNKATDRHPVETGNGRIPKEVIMELYELAKDLPDGDEVEVESAMWRKISKKGQEYGFVTFGPKRRTAGGDDIPF